MQNWVQVQNKWVFFYKFQKAENFIHPKPLKELVHDGQLVNICMNAWKFFISMNLGGAFEAHAGWRKILCCVGLSTQLETSVSNCENPKSHHHKLSNCPFGVGLLRTTEISNDVGSLSVHQMPGKSHLQKWSLVSGDGVALFKGLCALQYVHNNEKVAEALERGVWGRTQSLPADMGLCVK